MKKPTSLEQRLKKDKRIVARKRQQKSVLEIKWDDAAREDYLTGFHKRKLQRQKKAQERAQEREREAKREERRIVCPRTHNPVDLYSYCVETTSTERSD